ncbi:MAG: CCA tRNA nucleotidyltransferase [Acidobacteria bacterium]|nr:CCA tRNA nucleotidyltransferase [Acidobacteriota bacterium]
MADYIYTMETRLTPDQQRGVQLVQEAARAHELNLYLTGGAIRDIISGLTIRDLDFTVQGSALKLQRDLEKAGADIENADEDLRSLQLLLPGNVRAEIAMARAERYEKPGKPPEIAPATIVEDLRRRDFTVNAMALSLNTGSRGLLLDPANGAADIESKLLRILHNYSFLDDPSRLIRATRFAARFHWTLEERTQARYAAAVENGYIEYVSSRALGCEIEQLAYEDDPVHVLRTLEKEGWLKVLSPHWTVGRVDTDGLSQVLKMRQQAMDHGYSADLSPAVLYFMTRRLQSREQAGLLRVIPRKALVEKSRKLHDEARALAARLAGKEAATPSRAWRVLTESPVETILFLETTTRQQGVRQKIRNFYGKWRQLRQKLPFVEMAELNITPALPAYQKLSQEAFLLLLDGKLRSRSQILKFLKPYAPPPPPPPPPPKKRAAKAEAPPEAAPAKKEKGKAAAAPAPAATPPKTAAKAPPRPEKKVAPAKPSKPAKKARPKAKLRPQPKPKKAAKKSRPAKKKKRR